MSRSASLAAYSVVPVQTKERDQDMYCTDSAAKTEAGTTGPGCASDPRVPQPAAVAGPGASRAQSALSRNWVASCFWKGVL